VQANHSSLCKILADQTWYIWEGKMVERPS
jgi:hypothetical protein